MYVQFALFLQGRKNLYVCMHVFMSVSVYECGFLCVFEGERSDGIADGAP